MIASTKQEEIPNTLKQYQYPPPAVWHLPATELESGDMFVIVGVKLGSRPNAFGEVVEVPPVLVTVTPTLLTARFLRRLAVSFSEKQEKNCNIYNYTGSLHLWSLTTSH